MYVICRYMNDVIEIFHSLRCRIFALHQCVLTGNTCLGNMVPYNYWTAAELAISIVCICLPNMTQLFRRAHQHGISALFTRRDYVGHTEFRFKMGPTGFVPVQAPKRRFQRLFGKDHSTFAAYDYKLITSRDQGASHSPGAVAQQSEGIELGVLDLVHLRQDINATENERWDPV